MNNVKIDDVIRVTVNMKAGTEVWTARFTGAERRNEGTPKAGWYFGFVPCNRPDTIQCGFGYQNLLDNPGQWGCQSVEVIGHESPESRTLPNLFRLPGYDLVNM